jgi:magnesium chelatase family protein
VFIVFSPLYSTLVLPMFSYVYSAAYYGVQGYIVKVEAHISRGLPHFKIVGLPDKSVEESKDRVAAALKSSGFTFPLRRITINLAPSHIPKHGPSLDLPIALAILSASEQLHSRGLVQLKNCVFSGELGLDGTMKQIKGLPILFSAASAHAFSYFLSPPQDTSTTSPDSTTALIARSLKEAITILSSKHIPQANQCCTHARSQTIDTESTHLSETIPIGCASELRALSIAAAGHLNLSLYGPPGCGKTLIAQSILALLPPQTEDECHERRSIYSITDETYPSQPPFRQPHTSISLSGMVGGGPHSSPGEVTLAHNGILFLDELPEFPKTIIASLKRILDTGYTTIVDKGNRIRFPADFILITAMNRCPCGYLGHPVKPCSCRPYQLQQFSSRVPSALWDRIEIHLDVKPLDLEKTDFADKNEAFDHAAQRIALAKEIQRRKARRNDTISLAEVNNPQLMTKNARTMLDHAYQTLGLSTRKLLHTIRIAQTIADLEQNARIQEDYIAEALSYRKTVD